MNLKIDELNHLQILKEGDIELCGNEVVEVGSTGIKIIHNSKNYAVVTKPTEQEGFVMVLNQAKINDLNGVPFSEFIENFKTACSCCYAGSI